MNKTKILLTLPIVIWLLWIGGIELSLLTAQEVVLPVRGYDPRDIFAGRYLSIQTDYSDFSNDCEKDRAEKWEPKTAYACIDSVQITLEKPSDCAVYIKGYCQYSRFHDGVERFYVPEGVARPAETAVNDRGLKTEILLKVTKDGQAFPKDLLINGQSYVEWMKQQKSPR